jgi:hypothetical protein
MDTNTVEAANEALTQNSISPSGVVIVAFAIYGAASATHDATRLVKKFRAKRAEKKADVQEPTDSTPSEQ